MNTTTRFLLFGKLVTSERGIITAQWRTNPSKDFRTADDAENFIHEELNKERKLLEGAKTRSLVKWHEMLADMFKEVLEKLEETQSELCSKRKEDYNRYKSELDEFLKNTKIGVEESDHRAKLWIKGMKSFQTYFTELLDTDRIAFLKLLEIDAAPPVGKAGGQPDGQPGK